MEEDSAALNSTNDSCLNRLPDPSSSVHTLHEPFLNFEENTELSFEDKSTIFCSLVALVKAEYPFDNALQDRAVRFLEYLEPMWNKLDFTEIFITDLVPTSAGSPFGFIESIVTLLSSSHLTVVTAVLSFLQETTVESSTAILCRLVESGLVSNVLATVQPHTLPIAGNDTMMNNLVKIIKNFASPASPLSLSNLGITTAVDKYTHCEMIFEKVMLPSSQFVTFLISKRHVLSGRLFQSFMSLLDRFIDMAPFHRPTLEFALASPIVMGFSSCLSIVEDFHNLWDSLYFIYKSLKEWTYHGPEVAQSGKRMVQALFSEGFEDTLEQMMKHDKDGYSFDSVVYMSHSISQMLGSNVELTEDDDDEEESEDEVASLE
ncbi:hypothetical protein BLNAU_7273 [Blattamonas nauphoetae]|uniref:Uncharacterized protein n=1 Tax=Blattamonas nauphoetae TaxID=2049346 RepID=A0ABQ9Y278_9EUKA|nr:hypothetical protein BLNAU_7273 [Blattamonas nauphoetae]